ncbi:MAG: hypothetical protein FWC79_04660 [Oscillospiraceae bacterium]|nr:hypothetical protein [Oscillospiraceae bacterium]
MGTVLATADILKYLRVIYKEEYSMTEVKGIHYFYPSIMGEKDFVSYQKRFKAENEAFIQYVSSGSKAIVLELTCLSSVAFSSGIEGVSDLIIGSFEIVAHNLTFSS